MSNFNLTTIQGKNIVIDISQLVSKEVLYINATKLALQFGKNKRNHSALSISHKTGV